MIITSDMVLVDITNEEWDLAFKCCLRVTWGWRVSLVVLERYDGNNPAMLKEDADWLRCSLVRVLYDS